MKLRLRNSVRNSVQVSVALGVLMGTVVGCGDDGTSIPTLEVDGGSSSDTASGEPTSATPTSGDEPTDTTGPTTTTNPTTTTPVETSDETTGPVDTSGTPVQTTTEVQTSDDGTDLPTTGPVTSDVSTGIVDTTGPGTEDTGGPVTPIGVGAEAPPNDIVLVSDFEVGDDQGFVDGPGDNGVTPTFTFANSVASLEIPFTKGGNQSGGIDFNTSGNHCGEELVVRTKLVSGFDAGGHIQLRAWSSDWSVFVGNWVNFNAAENTGDWIEYSFDLDAAAEATPAFDVTAVNHVGIAMLTGGTASDVFTTATFEIDWIGFREKAGGCPGDNTSDTGSTTGATDTGAVSDPDAGVVDTGETAVPDDDAGAVDTSAPATGDASVDEPTLDLGDASVSEPPATSSAPESSSSAPVASSSEPEPYGPNLHTNSGFEASADYWYLTGGGSVARSTTYAHTGTYSLYNTGRTATWNGAGTNLVSNGFVTAPLVQGGTYLIQVWVRLEGLASATVALSGSFMCDGTQTQPWLANATANDTGWTLVSGEFTAPSCGGAGLTDASLIVNNPGTAASIYIDDFSVQEVLN